MRTKRISLRKTRRSEIYYSIGLKFSGLILVALFIVSNLPAQTLADSYVNIEPGEVSSGRREVVSTNVPPPPKIQKEDPLQLETLEGLPVEEKQRLIALLLSEYNYSEDKVNTFLRIAKAESGLNEKRLGMLEVRHCKGVSGWYVVEMQSVGGLNVQADCRQGDLRGRTERSYGIFQILETTWEGYGCDGYIYKSNWKQQVQCAVRIEMKSGFKSWSTY